MAKLMIIPTPIGNLGDITLRSIDMLKEADVLLAEDTRVTARLLQRLGISKTVLPFHKFNEHKTLASVVSRIQTGETFALVSDAGTPSISDPGFLIVRECLRNQIEVECLPGATAFVPALVNSGLPSERFCFEGFLPIKKGRHTRLSELAEETRTLIFYEAPHRLLKTLEQLAEYFGADRQASVSRELTKQFEETQRGSISEIIRYFKDKTVKGEIVIVVAGKNRKGFKDESNEEE